MTMRTFTTAIVLAFAFTVQSLAADPPRPTSRPAAGGDERAAEHVKETWAKEEPEINSRMRRITLAMVMYSMKHDHHLPPTLGDVLDFMVFENEKTTEEKARVFLTPADQERVQMPDVLTPEWINRNSSFVYLGGNVDLQQVPPDSDKVLILLHTNLDTPLLNPHDGEVIIATWRDAHAEVLGVDRARQLIVQSKEILGGARKN